MKIHIGPGQNWDRKKYKKDNWYTIDIDEKRGDYVLNFDDFEKLPFKTNSIECIYASHVFEHISIYVKPLLFKECYRVLKKGGWLRVITPNPRISMIEYLNNNKDFKLFKRRKQRNPDYTLFECLKEDFLSKTMQKMLKKNQLAHQNAWDEETMIKDFIRAGFDKKNVFKSSFNNSKCSFFSFENIEFSEANETYRSLYIDGQK